MGQTDFGHGQGDSGRTDPSSAWVKPNRLWSPWDRQKKPKTNPEPDRTDPRPKTRVRPNRPTADPGPGLANSRLLGQTEQNQDLCQTEQTQGRTWASLSRRKTNSAQNRLKRVELFGEDYNLCASNLAPKVNLNYFDCFSTKSGAIQVPQSVQSTQISVCLIVYLYVTRC